MDKDCRKKGSRENKFFNENSFCCEDDFFSEKEFAMDLNDTSDCCDNCRRMRKENRRASRDNRFRNENTSCSEDDFFSERDFDTDLTDRNRKSRRRRDDDNDCCRKRGSREDRFSSEDSSCSEDDFSSERDFDTDLTDRTRTSRRRRDEDCCKEELEKIFWFLFNPCVKDLIDQDSILLGSTFFWACVDQIKKSCTCKGLLDFTGRVNPGNGPSVDGNFTISFCDLIAISFKLNPFVNNACCSCRPVNQDTCFTRRLLRLLGCCDDKCSDTSDICDTSDISEDKCSCNKEKAACLCNTIGEVNLIINRTTPNQVLENLNVIAVTDNIVVVRETGDDPFYHIICLNAIGAIF